MARATPDLAPPLQTSAAHQGFPPLVPATYDLACSRPTYTVYRLWNRVSSLEPSGLEAETLPLGQRGACELTKTMRKK
ncbi:hypothetical protein AVEN_128089-1 [Araneus ventricosus]|uniref:Uncharacterized protein n=1 Tax=Araneus ventricosus TaxID=182803 RepID=A0A4Y1ZZG8_ARAVE|nr:hypothetical protein AVEN_128089-1 [Araneus ventricosus]